MSSVLTGKILVRLTSYYLFPDQMSNVFRDWFCNLFFDACAFCSRKFRSDKKYFGLTKPIRLSVPMTDRSSDNLWLTEIGYAIQLNPLYSLAGSISYYYSNFGGNFVIQVHWLLFNVQWQIFHAYSGLRLIAFELR